MSPFNVLENVLIFKTGPVFSLVFLFVDVDYSTRDN